MCAQQVSEKSRCGRRIFGERSSTRAWTRGFSVSGAPALAHGHRAGGFSALVHERGRIAQPALRAKESCARHVRCRIGGRGCGTYALLEVGGEETGLARPCVFGAENLADLQTALTSHRRDANVRELLPPCRFLVNGVADDVAEAYRAPVDRMIRQARPLSPAARALAGRIGRARRDPAPALSPAPLPPVGITALTLVAQCGISRSLRGLHCAFPPPVCLLSGGPRLWPGLIKDLST